MQEFKRGGSIGLGSADEVWDIVPDDDVAQTKIPREIRCLTDGNLVIHPVGNEVDDDVTIPMTAGQTVHYRVDYVRETTTGTYLGAR
jgi:hypothetical protein